MRISLNWIKRILNVNDLGVATPELINRLTLRVAEFEADYTCTGPKLDGVVVGKVLTCVQHPNADKLRCTTVDLGNGIVERIVCGAPNVAVGQTVAVATLGTTLTMPGKDGTPQSLTIKEAKLRGELSRGMICAEDELGLGTSHDGILVLEERWAAGTPLSAVFAKGDTVLSIENSCLTNRPDLWGHWGWAHEIATILGLNPPTALDTTWQPCGEGWSATLHSDGGLRYCGAVVEGVSNQPSPQWMQDLLTAVGLRPLGFLVDLTNFVMLDIGEPMHAFDRRDLAGSRIQVRNAAAGELFKTLDGREHKLCPDDLLIADDRRAVALAGIMGGENSMVKDDTTTLVLEAATFHSGRIRRTRIRTGVATDSSARFEKGLYPELAAAGLNRALALIREVLPQARITHRFDSGVTSSATKTVHLAPDAVRRITGIEVPVERQRTILTSLGFTVSDDSVGIPWWRSKDVGRAADLVEEIARHHGYERIAPETPRLPAAAPTQNLLRTTEHRTRRALSALGWDEVATYAFTSGKWLGEIISLPGSPDWAETKRILNRCIKLDHPLSEEHSILRPSLLWNLLEAVGRNRKHAGRVAIYELGKRYGYGIGSGSTPDEELMVAGVIAAADDESPYFAARDAALGVLRTLGFVPRYAIRSEPHPELIATRSVDLFIDKLPVGVAGEVPKHLRTLAACPERVGWFCLRLEHLVATLGLAKPVAHRMPSRFPAVDREFTWVCPEDKPFGELAEVTRQSAGALCTGVDLITIYRGDPIATGQKAVSLRVTLQSDEKTLEEKDLHGICQRVVQLVEKRTGAQLRA
jgi:phenylalanyl-tRNA synthetase beta chain